MISASPSTGCARISGSAWRKPTATARSCPSPPSSTSSTRTSRRWAGGAGTRRRCSPGSNADMQALPLSKESSTAEIVAWLRTIGSEENRQGMLRYGIAIDRALGISHGDQRRIGKAIGRNHERAFELWETGITEAQFIASITADPKRFTAADARRWAAG